tara:strand:+ start:55 stop:939 length:885 start_codon:yes stop_codon:yes gene_type:complete
MFYRRKIILALIDLLGGELEKIRFQKLLFLYSMKKKNPEYDFVPYKFGCYSYSAKADMNTMVKKELLSENESSYIKLDQTSYFGKLKKEDQNTLRQVVLDYGSMSSSTLVKHTYLNFPFYAINSTISNDVLLGKLHDRIDNATPKINSKGLYTLGYEGISLEKYLQKLIINNIKLLIDVRKNPLSMKFGFSKTLLKRYCNSLGIDYLHIPNVGISSDKRRELNSQLDYDNLFEDYKQTTLKETKTEQVKILDLIDQYDRVALTCFEAKPCQCHRTHLAESVTNLPSFSYALSHL